MLKAGKLKSLRENNKYTLQQIADEIGFAQNTVHNWESGKRLPDIETLSKLSTIYGVKLEELLESKDTYEKVVWLAYHEHKEKIDRIIGNEKIPFDKDDSFGIFIHSETHEWLGSAEVSFDFYDGDLDAHTSFIVMRKDVRPIDIVNAIWDVKLEGEPVTCITGIATTETKTFWENTGAIFDDEWEYDENNFHIYDKYL